MQYGGIVQLPSLEVGEVVEVTKRKIKREPYPGYTIFGNGKETRYGGKSVDILDICKQLNTAEMNLLQTIRDAIEQAKANKEKNVNLFIPAKLDTWDNYLKVALKKNYPHMHCLEIIRRVKRGIYMANPMLFIPPEEVEWHKGEWDSLEGGCNEGK